MRTSRIERRIPGILDPCVRLHGVRRAAVLIATVAITVAGATASVGKRSPAGRPEGAFDNKAILRDLEHLQAEFRDDIAKLGPAPKGELVDEEGRLVDPEEKRLAAEEQAKVRDLAARGQQNEAREVQDEYFEASVKRMDQDPRWQRRVFESNLAEANALKGLSEKIKLMATRGASSKKLSKLEATLRWRAHQLQLQVGLDRDLFKPNR